jgi:hypothetical protein
MQVVSECCIAASAKERAFAANRRFCLPALSFSRRMKSRCLYEDGCFSCNFECMALLHLSDSSHSLDSLDSLLISYINSGTLSLLLPSDILLHSSSEERSDMEYSTLGGISSESVRWWDHLFSCGLTFCFL